MSSDVNRQGKTPFQGRKGTKHHEQRLKNIQRKRNRQEKQAAFLKTLKLKIRAVSLGGVTSPPNTPLKQPSTHALTTQRARAQKKCTRARFKQ